MGGFDSSQAFSGLIDELSIWNRTLSADEIKNLYKRGALRLNLSLRSCDDGVAVSSSLFEVVKEEKTAEKISNAKHQTLLLVLILIGLVYVFVMPMLPLKRKSMK